MRSHDVDPRRLRDVVAVVLAGGRGARLDPLTRDRAKPAVPFGGSYRIVDFALSNCLNSGLKRLLLLPQYKARSLDRHLNLGWHRFFCRDLGEFLDVLPRSSGWTTIGIRARPTRSTKTSIPSSRRPRGWWSCSPATTSTR